VTDLRKLAGSHGKSARELIDLGEKSGWISTVLLLSIYTRAKLAAHYGREALGE
jgi:hypothetical protein